MVLFSPFNSYATVIHVINPNDDGSIYDNGGVVTYAYLLSSYSIRGVVEFPLNSIAGTIEGSSLSVNPYGLPLWDKTVEVFAYESNDGILTSADYNAGVFLGIWTLPDLGYGQDAFFDVTGYLQSATSPFIGFNLRTDEGADVFSSLEYNYSHPAQLTITESVIPEPATAITMLLSIFGLALARYKKS